MEKEKSIWDEVPDNWKNKKTSPITKTESYDNTPSCSQYAEEIKEKQGEVQKEQEKPKKKTIKKDPEYVQKAYQDEKKKNRKDFMILGIVMSAVIAGIAIFVVLFTETSTQQIYQYIDQENYSIAYQNIQELYEKDKNVDALVYDFSIECANHSEYKRAVAALDFLSSDAENNAEFFQSLLEILFNHGKNNRAEQVLDYMHKRGGELSSLADNIYEEHKDQM